MLVVGTGKPTYVGSVFDTRTTRESRKYLRQSINIDSAGATHMSLGHTVFYCTAAT